MRKKPFCVNFSNRTFLYLGISFILEMVLRSLPQGVLSFLTIFSPPPPIILTVPTVLTYPFSLPTVPVLH